MTSLQDRIAEIDVAFARKDFANAQALAMTALAQSPGDAELLVRAAGASHKLRDWDAVSALARRLLRVGTLSGHQLLRAVELACISAYMLGGLEAVRPLYTRYGRQIQDIAAAQPDQTWFVQAALRCAILGGDHAASFGLFLQLFPPRWEGLTMAVSRTRTLQSFCGAHGIPITVFETAHLVTSADAPDPCGDWHYVTETGRHAVIPKAEVLLGWDFVIAPTGEVISDSGYSPVDVSYAWFSHHVIEGTDLVAHCWSPAVQTVDLDVIVLSGPERFHIGHWILDFLPQLRAFDPASGRKIVVPASAPKKFFELLALFGVSEDAILRLDIAKRYKFRSVQVIRHGRAVHPSRDGARFLGDTLAKPAAADAPRRRIFLDRDAPTRRIVNRDAFDGLLTELGFETLSLAKMSIAEQRAALGTADIVMGAHGSEMLACFFMPKGAHLVEFNYEATERAWENAATCSHLDVRHHLFVCRSADSGARIQKKDFDFHVDIAALRALIAQIGG